MDSPKKGLIALVLGVILLVGLWMFFSQNQLEEEEWAITWEELPPAVKTTVLEHADDYEVVELEEVNIGDQIFYEAEWLEGDMEVEIRMDEAGNLIHRQEEKVDKDGGTEEYAD